MPSSRLHRSPLLVLLALLFAGCGVAPMINASDYDQTCRVDADCAVILVGSICECKCEYGAVNQQAVAKVQADRNARRCDGSKQCGPCPGRQAQCSSGRCAVRP